MSQPPTTDSVNYGLLWHLCRNLWGSVESRRHPHWIIPDFVTSFGGTVEAKPLRSKPLNNLPIFERRQVAHAAMGERPTGILTTALRWAVFNAARIFRGRGSPCSR